MGIVRNKAKFIHFVALLSVFKGNVEGTISVINEETGNVERIIEDRNIRSMSDALEGYIIIANPANVCELPDPPPSYKPFQIDKEEEDPSTEAPPILTDAEYFAEVERQGRERGLEEEAVPLVKKPKKKWILLGVIYDCDLTTKARNAQQSGYSGLIVQNIGTNNSNLIPWHIMRFPLARINHVVVGEYEGALLRYNYSYPDNGYYVKFEEDHLYQILCYILAGIILLLLSTMFLLFWLQICCTIIALRLPYRVGQRFHVWLNPGKRRLTRHMLQLLPIKNWTQTDPFQACAICQEDFREDEKVRVLPCVHGFHSVCIDPWLLKRSRKCPNCMRWVKLPDEPDFLDDDDDDSDDIYSALNLNHSSPQRSTNRTRRCTQNQPEVQLEEQNAENNAPIIDVPCPKNIILRETSFLPNDDSVPEIMITTFTQEETPRTSSVSETREKMKRFLQNCSNTLAPNKPCGSRNSYTKAVSNPRTTLKLSPLAIIPHSRSLPLELVSPDDSEIQNQGNAEAILETCIDIPSNSPYQNTIKMGTAEAILPREYSNPGYISVDDDSEDCYENTEEQDLSSSFDATTISESLPRDDVSIRTTTSTSILKDDDDEDEKNGKVYGENNDDSDSDSFLSDFIPVEEAETEAPLPPIHCLMTVAVAVAGGVDVTVVGGEGVVHGV